MNPNEMSGGTLAYLGDAVLELMTRERLLESGITDVGRLNAMALSFVKATAQSDAVAKLEMYLTPDELTFYKRGRNAHGVTAPKSATAPQYRRATGLESLFAYLYLTGNNERMNELYDLGFRSGSGSAAGNKGNDGADNSTGSSAGGGAADNKENDGTDKTQNSTGKTDAAAQTKP